MGELTEGFYSTVERLAKLEKDAEKKSRKDEPERLKWPHELCEILKDHEKRILEIEQKLKIHAEFFDNNFEAIISMFETIAGRRKG